MSVERDLSKGTLADTGALVSVIVANDRNHARCVAVLPKIKRPFVSTQACLTEALHLLDRAEGFVAQTELWNWIDSGDLYLLDWSEDDTERAREFVFRYQPFCDYADATLLVAAERTGLRRVFTIDGHFFAYRLTDGVALIVLPGPGR